MDWNTNLQNISPGRTEGEAAGRAEASAGRVFHLGGERPGRRRQQTGQSYRVPDIREEISGAVPGIAGRAH